MSDKSVINTVWLKNSTGERVIHTVGSVIFITKLKLITGISVIFAKKSVVYANHSIILTYK